MTIVTHLAPDDRQFLAEALLLRGYVGHELAHGVPDCASEVQAHLALKLAKLLGIKDEYWAVMQRTDVLSIAVRNLDDPPKRTGRRKKLSPTSP